MTNIVIKPDQFPVTFRAVDIGVYFFECKAPKTMADLSRAQVLLDNNLLGVVVKDPLIFLQRISWYVGAQTLTSINLGLSVTEQFLSNGYDAAYKNIEAAEKALQPFKIFEPGLTARLFEEAKEQEASLRHQLGILFCYLGVLKSLYITDMDPDLRLKKWSEFFSEDIPRLQFLYVLGYLFLLSKKESTLRLIHSSAPFSAEAMKFFDLRKEEKVEPGRWFRNRSFDLLLLQLAPAMCFSQAGGYPSRVIIATKDNFVGEVLGQIFCWVGEQSYKQGWLLYPRLSAFVTKEPSIAQALSDLRSRASPGRESASDNTEARIKNLLRISGTLIRPEIQQDLGAALTLFNIRVVN
ncbi:MAG TPA: hypothetical protein VED40_23070 [Azospirillaceae bacterium]|nr:hypothetical protein [Azospirillaceae bacterium]